MSIKPNSLRSSTKRKRNRNPNPVLKALDKDRPLPPYPTDAEPGSLAKIAIMQQRDTDGYQIHHPDDCTDYSVFVAIANRLQALEDGDL